MIRRATLVRATCGGHYLVSLARRLRVGPQRARRVETDGELTHTGHVRPTSHTPPARVRDPADCPYRSIGPSRQQDIADAQPAPNGYTRLSYGGCITVGEELATSLGASRLGLAKVGSQQSQCHLADEAAEGTDDHPVAPEAPQTVGIGQSDPGFHGEDRRCSPCADHPRAAPAGSGHAGGKRNRRPSRPPRTAWATGSRPGIGGRDYGVTPAYEGLQNDLICAGCQVTMGRTCDGPPESGTGDAAAAGAATRRISWQPRRHGQPRWHGGLTLGGGVRLASAFPATGREDVLTGHAEHDE